MVATRPRRRIDPIPPAPLGGRPELTLVRPCALVVIPPEARGSTARLRRRSGWRTPRLEELRRPVWTRGRVVGMVALRVYVLLAVVLVAARLAATALGH
jgi:hypothetical protein